MVHSGNNLAGRLVHDLFLPLPPAVFVEDVADKTHCNY